MVTSRKGQMKIQQMAFMLIAVTLFFALVGMFFLSIVFSDLKNSGALLEEKNALFLVAKLANSPEFSCGEVFGSSETSCIDADKVMVLKQNIAKYSNFWGTTGIEIKKIYPPSDVICTNENYPDCGEIKILETSTGIGVSSFVALCRKELKEGVTQDKCEIAKVIVTYEG